MASTNDVLVVQSRLQDLFDSLPAGQAGLLEAVVTGTPLEIRDTTPDGATGADERAIIIVSGRAGRWLVFDMREIMDDLNPQPLPPDPPDLRPFG